MGCDLTCQDAILGYADIVSGVFTALALIISAHQVFKHLKHYTNPFFQNRTMLIIFMAPIYALTSFLGVVSHDSHGYFALVRDIYEAVLIYAFFKLLSSYLAFDPEEKKINYDRIYEMLSTKGVRPHIWPMNYIFSDLVLISHIRGRWFFRKCSLYILQYLVIKPTVTLFLIIAYATNAPDVVSLLLQSIVFISVSFSLYYLILFYYTLHEELAYMKPLLKFLSVKAVLFFTFWQDLVLDMFSGLILSSFGDVSDERGQLLIEVSECLLVCFEMVILAVVTSIAFSYKDFRDSQKKNWLLEDPGVTHLARTFMSNVVSENFVTTLEDLKELGSPIKDPFKSFKPSEVTTHLHDSPTTKDRSLAESQEAYDFKDYQTHIYEKPQIIPGFIGNDEI